jgi:uncharacterized cupin superfamily protein
MSLGARVSLSDVETFNLFSGETDESPSKAPGYEYRTARLGSRLGGSRLGMSVYDLPPGQAIGAYHFEWTDEEWLIALHGHVTVRTREGDRVFDPGDVICFPAGPEGAHEARNASDEPVRVAIFSTKNEFGIVEYPDDHKVGIWAGDEHYTLDRPPT